MCIFEFTAHNMQRGMTLSLDNYSSPSLGKWKCSDLPSSANMGRSTVNYQQSLAHIYHVMIIVTGGFSKIAGLTAFNFTSPSSQKILQHRCFPENIAKFLWTALSVWWSNCSVMGICWSSLLNQNKKCGMVSTKKVCRSGQSMLFTHY